MFNYDRIKNVKYLEERQRLNNYQIITNGKEIKIKGMDIWLDIK